jgi:hypothetical protein
MALAAVGSRVADLALRYEIHPFTRGRNSRWRALMRRVSKASQGREIENLHAKIGH